MMYLRACKIPASYNLEIESWTGINATVHMCLSLGRTFYAHNGLKVESTLGEKSNLHANGMQIIIIANTYHYFIYAVKYVCQQKSFDPAARLEESR